MPSLRSSWMVDERPHGCRAVGVKIDDVVIGETRMPGASKYLG